MQTRFQCALDGESGCSLSGGSGTNNSAIFLVICEIQVEVFRDRLVGIREFRIVPDSRYLFQREVQIHVHIMCASRVQLRTDYPY